MHEVSIAGEIIKIVRESVPPGSLNCVKFIMLDIGEYSNIMPEALCFGFSVLSKGTELEGSELIINKIPLKVKCSFCNSISVIEPGFFYCPECGSNDVKIIGGQEMNIVSIEIEENVAELYQ